MSRPALLALRALGLGDLLTAVPALRALALAFPGHDRVLALPAALAPLALHAGLAHRTIPADPLTPVPWSGPPPDVAVNLHGKGPESHAVLGALRPRRTIAFACGAAPGGGSGPEWRADEHEVQRLCRLLSESGIPSDPSRLDIPAPRGCHGCPSRGATLLHPGAASAARRWPAERWAKVARSLREAGRRVVVTGGPAEVDLASSVARAAGLDRDAVLAGATPVMDLARAVAAAERVVCGDTGVAHLATALRRPSVVLFGPTPPALWGPPADRPWHRALWAGATGDPHGREPSAGLLEIEVEDVLAALRDLPSSEVAR